MENYRNVSIKHFKLDPVHYYTTPGFAWNARKEKTSTKYLLDLDTNNLYGWAMCKYLPYKGFKWCNPDLFNTENILRMTDEQENCYIFEVDLKNPEELHDLHSDYPLAPENYEFYYNVLKKIYEKNIRLLYTDADSLIVEISTDDFYTDVKNNEQLLNEFGFSDYPKNNKYGIPQINKKVPDKFKDELNGQIITEFVGLRSKLYSFKLFEN
ncbi:DNA polymerase, palm domain [Cinara cedri]|uniref:DNA polymerase, palm domain n=1 Tax=Cinara cedri TaxID=506608 RepID=A0A5E4NPF2_9HEMI|nr:DNA polymerase, palm domain [Cinara cedri]